MTSDKPSQTHRGVLRRRAARLAAQGLIRVCEYDPGVDAYTIVTAAGDTVVVPRRDMPAYLQGLAHGAFAALHPIPRAGQG